MHNFTHLDATKAANPTDSQPKFPRISQTVSQNSNRHSLKRHASGSARCSTANNQPVTEAAPYTAKLYPRRSPHYAPRWSMANCNEETELLESARPITSALFLIRLVPPRNTSARKPKARLFARSLLSQLCRMIRQLPSGTRRISALLDNGRGNSCCTADPQP